MKTKEITVCGLFAAAIAVGAFLKVNIPLPLYEMHFTLQWLFVMLAAFVLGAKFGSLSVATYLLMGLMGLPIFAAGGGPAYVFRPGFGFLLGFLAAAYIMGKITEKSQLTGFTKYITAATVGLLVYYGIGAVYFYAIKNFYVGESVSFMLVLVQYCLITILPDFLLCLLASEIAVRVIPALGSRSLIQE